MSWEGCAKCGHEIIYIKGEWLHKDVNGAKSKLCFHDGCEEPRPNI